MAVMAMQEVFKVRHGTTGYAHGIDPDDSNPIGAGWLGNMIIASYPTLYCFSILGHIGSPCVFCNQHWEELTK